MLMSAEKEIREELVKEFHLALRAMHLAQSAYPGFLGFRFPQATHFPAARYFSWLSAILPTHNSQTTYPALGLREPHDVHNPCLRRRARSPRIQSRIRSLSQVAMPGY